MVAVAGAAILLFPINVYFNSNLWFEVENIGQRE